MQDHTPSAITLVGMHRLLAALTACALLTQALHAEETYSAGLRLLGQGGGGNAGAVSSILQLDAHTVLTDAGAVYDLTDPTLPRWLADSGWAGVDLVRAGTTGYLASGRNGLTILELSDPAHLTRLGAYRTSGDARALDVVGSLAFVAAADAGLRVIDVANPARTDQVAQYPSSLAETLVANDMLIRSNLAYFAAGPDTLEILRIANPSSLLRVGGMRGGLNALWAEWLGDRLLLAGATGGLLLVDVSTPSQPTIVGSYADLPGSWTLWSGIAVIQNLCYVAAGYDGILIVDCADPAHPKLAGAYKPLVPVLGVTALAGHILAAHGDSGFSVLEPVSNAVAAPRIVFQPQATTVAVGAPARLEVQAEPVTGLSYQWYFGLTPLAGATGPVLAFDAVTREQDGSYSVLVANASGSVQSDPAKLTVILPPEIFTQPQGTAVLEGETVTLQVTAFGNGILEYQWYKDGVELPAATGSTLSLASATPAAAGGYSVRVRNIAGSVTSSLAAVTVRPSMTLRQIGRWPAVPDGEFLGRVRSVGNLAYVAQGAGGLQVLDITDPTAPRRLGGYFGGGYASGLQIVDHTLYLADGNVGGLTVLDISDPTQPLKLGRLQTASSVNDVRVIGNLAYLAAGVKGLSIVDVSDPAALKVVGEFPNSYGAARLEVVGNWVYIADSTGGLLIFDVTDPTQPAPVTQYAKPDFGEYSVPDVQVVGPFAYVPRTYDGFSVVDVSDPRHPAGVGYVSGYSRTVRVVGDYAYVGRLDAGFRVLDITTPQRPLIVAEMDTPGEAVDTEVVGNLVLVADGKDGLLILQSSLSTTPERARLSIERGPASALLRIRCPGESPAVLEHSTDLRVWTPILTNRPTAGAAASEFSIDPTGGSAVDYFRVVQ